MESASDAEWSTLQDKRIFFGHQSVGRDILDGVAAIVNAKPSMGLRVSAMSSMDKIQSAGLYHASIGVNGDPMTKISSFAEIVGRNQVDMAMMKFCYLDIDGRLDPDSLLGEYERTVERLKRNAPTLRIVHVTIPLTDNGNWKERLVKRVKGRRSARELNRLRNRFNSNLRRRYLGQDPIFDLAEIESTRADGAREFEMWGAEAVYVLASDMTSDGGHLNERGKETAARAYLSLLASL